MVGIPDFLSSYSPISDGHPASCNERMVTASKFKTFRVSKAAQDAHFFALRSITRRLKTEVWKTIDAAVCDQDILGPYGYYKHVHAVLASG